MKLILAPHKILLHIYPKAAASFMVRNPDTPNKGISMKRFILVGGMALMASMAHAGSLNYCNNNAPDSKTDTSIQPFAGYRKAITIPATGLAPSITLPSPISGNGIMHVMFTDNSPVSATICFDGTSPTNILCNAGVPPANSVTGTDAWQPVPAPNAFSNPIRALAIVSGTLPGNPSTTFVPITTLYVSSTTATAQTLHISVCQEY